MKQKTSKTKLRAQNSESKSLKEKLNTANSNFIETISYSLLIATLVALVFYLHHFDPVHYATFLITEARWGEYLTSINFGLASMLLIALVFKPARRAQKVMWAIIGLTAFFIGAEEVAWGQKIFRITTPSFLYNVNLQHEITLHNLKYMQGIHYHRLVAYAMIGWSIFSAAITIWFPRLENRILALGLPLIPIKFILIFLTAPYFFIEFPVSKSDEIGELFLSIAVVVWAFDMFIRYGLIRHIRGLRAVISNIGVLLFAAVLSAAMTYMFPGNPGFRLNITASRDYPHYGMHDQAESIYEYIYSHPEYMRPETRHNHARMLLKLGDKEKALYILTEGVSEFEKSAPPEKQLSSYLRSLGKAFILLEQSEHADAKFNQAIKVDEQHLESASSQNAKAKLLWSIAKTLKARGDIEAAIDKAQQARTTAKSARLHSYIDEWIKSLSEKIE
jgi:hypothetical protein